VAIVLDVRAGVPPDTNPEEHTMSHHFDTGFSVREVPWHGLGKIRDTYPGTWAEARKDAGLEWDAVEVAVYEVGELYADGTAQVTLIEDFKQIKRSDNGLRLDIANATYEIIDHDTMGEMFEALLNGSTETPRRLMYETAGSLYEGRKVWALARIGDEIELPGDPSPIQPYLALLNSHDGTAALRAIATSVRIVCANTWHAAETEANARGSAYSFKHTKNWRSRVEDAKKALAANNEQIDHMIDDAKEMLQLKINARQQQTFIERFAIHRTIANSVGRKPKSKMELAARLDQPRVQAALHTTMNDLTAILNSRTCTGIDDTVWGLVQAAGEFTDHFRDSNSADSYFSRTVLADREPLKIAAVRIAHEVFAKA